MNATSLPISVSLALAAAAALIACAAPDSPPDPDEVTGQATQALRNCPDGVCEAPPPRDPRPTPTHPAPTTTPPPSNPPPAVTSPIWTPGSSSGNVLVEDYTFTCNDATHQIAYYAVGPNGQPVPSAEPLCWAIKDCILVAPMARMVSSSSSSGSPPQNGPICSGYTLVSQSYCSSGLTLRCYPLQGTCSCSR